MKIRWPRGRYNGRQIGGFTIKLTVDLLWWHWLPRQNWREPHGMPYLHWLCFHLRLEPAYRWTE